MDGLNLSVKCSLQLVLVAASHPTKGIKRGVSGDACEITRQTLSQPINATCISCQGEHILELPLNAADEKNALNWTVEHDGSILPNLHELPVSNASTTVFSFQGIRITSPSYLTGAIFSTCPGSEPHIHHIDYTRSIQAVLHHLQATLGTVATSGSQEHWLYAPPGAQMEVSIANDGIGFLDSTHTRVERLMKLCARQIDVLNMGQATLYTGANSTVRNAEITFNQGPSTLDSAQALAWIDLCLSAVLRCANAEQSFFDHEVSPRGQFGDPTFGASDLVRMLGTVQSTTSYYDDLLAGRLTRFGKAVASAMVAVWSGSTLASFALDIANKELEATKPNRILANVKVKLLFGAYGEFPERYLKMALVSLDKDR